ncbi:MAG: XRE family transcriptional regulator [Pseudomonadota bacterium]
MTKADFSVIRNLRLKWGLTSEELAGMAGLTRATVAKMESGEGNPTMETIEVLSAAFQLAPSELVRLAEPSRCEVSQNAHFGAEGLEVEHVWWPGFEIYWVRGRAGRRKESDPRRHENTAEVCLVLEGLVRAVVGGEPLELGPGRAIRFQALREHYFDLVEDSEFLLIHHHLV